MKKVLSLALAAVLGLTLAAPALAWENPFEDVPADFWAVEYIRQASEDGVIVGTGTDPETGRARFAPEEPLTAAQFAVITAGAFYGDRLDEAAGPWYAPFQRALENVGLTEGAGIRDWEQPMTRFQMAGVLRNIVRDKGVPLPDGAALEKAGGEIGDWEQVPEPYREAVALCYALELLSGVDETGAFAGEQTLTRAQAAAVYCRLAGAVRQEKGDPMQARLDQLAASIEEWKNFAGANSSYELYPGRLGTLFVGYRSGTPHGGSREMIFVRTDGSELDILELLPRYFMLGANYAEPREIRFSEDESRLTFVTPIREGKGGFGEPEEVKNWGDTLCTVDLASGTMESMKPLQAG